MKNLFSYSVIALLSAVFVLYTNNYYKSFSPSQKTTNYSETDTNINKLPEGYQYISNFNLKKNHKINSILQDSLGLMLFSDHRSITIFDGKNEQNIIIEDGPNIIKKSPFNNTVYVACRNGFGIITKDKNGYIIYESLSKKNYHNENYSDIFFAFDKVYFFNEEKIISINPDNHNDVKVEYQNQKELADHAFFFQNKLFLNLPSSGLHNIENDSLIKLNLKIDLPNSQIIFSINDSERIIFGTANNQILTFDGIKIKSFKTSSDDYIKESIITGGIDYNDQYFVVNTLNGGALVINKKTGQTEHTINYRTGLPDDEILSSYVCQSKALWLSHEYGISRVSFDIPVKNFGYYPGLQGKINAVKIIDSTLYVATGEGIFYLSEIKNYDEVKVATDKWVKSYVKSDPVISNANNIISNETENEITSEEESEETGFLKRWKDRRDKKKKEKDTEVEDDNTETNEVETDTEAITEEKPEEIKERYKTEYKKVTEYRKIYELQSVKYFFKKIENLNNKCKKLIEYNDGLLALTNSGLYYIKGNSAEIVIADDYIYDLTGIKSEKYIFVSGSKGLYKIRKSKTDFKVTKIENLQNGLKQIKNLYKINDETIWATYRNKVYQLKFKENRVVSLELYTLNSNINEDLIISEFKQKPVFISNENAYSYSEELNDFDEINELNELIHNAEKIFLTSDSSFIIYLENNSIENFNINKELPHLKYTKLFDFTENIITDDKDNVWLVSRDNMIYKIYPETNSLREFDIKVYNVTDNTGNSLKDFSVIQTQSDYKKITIHLLSPCYLKKDMVNYYFSIDSEHENDFIKSTDSRITIPELTPGSHLIRIYALNKINERSKTLKIQLIISPPFWQSRWFIIAAFAAFVLILSLTISGFYRRKQRKIREYNEILELKVKERTAEIQKQNKLIQKQNSEITIQNTKITKQNEEITGSIRYAGKIQNAALPETEVYLNYLKGFFILFKPRDIVSGDFYWVTEIQNKLFVAAVDCTGHGVPGGFLSMLGISFLNEIVKDLSRKEQEIKASDILNSLRRKIIVTLNQDEKSLSQDGMDIALAIFDKDKMMLNYSGANNPAYIIRNSKIHKLDADRMPIGYNKKLNDTPFSNKFVKVEKDDLIYLFSDGYADQFGGERNKKFNSRRFRELLLHLQKFPMNKQKEIADKILRKWQKNNIQIDDILLIGMQI